MLPSVMTQWHADTCRNKMTSHAAKLMQTWPNVCLSPTTISTSILTQLDHWLNRIPNAAHVAQPHDFIPSVTGPAVHGCNSSLEVWGALLQGEADLAAALFWELRSHLVQAQQQKRAGLRGSYRVGVITPYRQQRTCLQATFSALCGPLPKDVSPLHCAGMYCGFRSCSMQHVACRLQHQCSIQATQYAYCMQYEVHDRMQGW